MRARVSVLLVVVCVMTVLGAAQERGVLIIKVTDASGADLPGATVTLIGLNHPERRAISNERGIAAFVGLLPGIYEIRVFLNGFQTTSDEVTLDLGETKRVPVELRVASLQETVTVTGSSRPIDRGGRPLFGGKAASGAVAPAIDDERLIGRGRPGTEWNTEAYDHLDENPFRSVSTDSLSTFSIDVDTASYANVRRFLNRGGLPPAGAVRIEELINYFHFSYPQPASDRPFSITTELAECPWNAKHRLALIGLQGREIGENDTPPRNLVFLIDVSGSMMTADKLPLVRHGLQMLADTLTAKDRVAIVVYAGASGLVLPSTSGDRKASIRQAIAGLEAGGSTNGAAGIQLAYRTARESFIKGGVNRVILATDGDFNVGVTSQDALVRLIETERESGVFLSVLGVGTGNLKDSTMEKLADKGNGNYAYLDSLHEAHRVLVREAGSTLITIAKDVKIQVEFNPKTVNGYRLIGYENRMLRHEDFNDDKKDGGEIGAGHSVTAIYEIVPAGVEMVGAKVDALKYSTRATADKRREVPSRLASELLTVKLRYKQPDGDASELTSAVIADRVQAMLPNLGFASAVAEAGMLLKRSKHKGTATYASAIARARQFRGDDPDGYRAEFVRLLEIASSLARTDTTNR